MSEKITDHLMQNEYEKVFNHIYHTESNNILFGSKIPDGKPSFPLGLAFRLCLQDGIFMKIKKF